MWYWIFKAVFFIIFKLLFRLKTEGVENIPKKSNFIIVANHSSFLDPLIVMAVVPKKIHCITLRFLYKISWIGWFLHAIEALPIGWSSQKALDLLTRNKNVGLFPEGGISRDGKLKRFRSGAILLAIKTGRPIVPCAIWGSFEALPVTAKFPKLLPVRLKIGKPIYLLKQFEDYVDDIYLQEGILKLRNTIKEMIDAG